MEILKRSAKLYAVCIAGSIMCFVLAMTFSMIGSTMFGEQIGEIVDATKEGEQPLKSERFYFDDDGKYSDAEKAAKENHIAKAEADGYKVSVTPNKNTTVTFDVITQILLLFMMGVFIYNNLWNVGFKDINAVKMGHKKEDKLQGLKIGIIAAIPSIIVTAIYIIGKATYAKTKTVALLGFLNPYMNRAIHIITGPKTMTLSQLTTVEIFVIFGLLLFIPLLACIAYILGYKSIIITEKIIFKKNQEK